LSWHGSRSPRDDWEYLQEYQRRWTVVLVHPQLWAAILGSFSLSQRPIWLGERELYHCRMFQITTVSDSLETATHVYPKPCGFQYGADVHCEPAPIFSVLSPGFGSSIGHPQVRVHEKDHDRCGGHQVAQQPPGAWSPARH